MTKYCIYILLFLIGIATTAKAQRTGRERGGKGTFSLSNKVAQSNMPDSLLLVDSAALKAKRITAYQLTPLLGESYMAPMDTNRLNYANSTLVEGKSLAVGYLANLGSPAQTRIFSERKEARDFIFADAYDYYITDPRNALFYDTKTPYTNVVYTSGGGSDNKEEQLKGILTLNFGKKINIGGDIDYIYGRGHYNSNGNKLLSYRLFGSYRSDHYEMNAYLSNYNFVNYENGGIKDDRYITNPDAFDTGSRQFVSKDIPVRFTNTWNRVRGKQYFLTHRYNLGFDRTLEETDEEGNEKTVFVPVSSIIHTVEYEDNQRTFLSKDAGIDTCYANIFGNRTPINQDRKMEDRTSDWILKNTFALSLREGFQDWAKFGLTAFVNFEKRRFQMLAPTPGFDYGPYGQNAEGPLSLAPADPQIYDEFSTYIGAELSKRQGSILTYNARGELCLIGDDVGEFRATGNLQTRFPLFKKDATIKAVGYIKNVTPAFYLRHNHTRYFWWDMNLRNIQQVYAGAEVDLESTRTRLSAGVESIQNYVYIGKEGVPQQSGSNLQVVTARLKQDLHYRAFGWENEVAYQLSSDKKVLPLPQLSIYTNMYVAFKVAKVLTLQLGADMHYNTAYYAPYYEPASQQFRMQDKVKVGNYPMVNAYVNCHLKQARFFVMAYNLSSKFVDPNYFSLAHYPLNSMVLKLGVAVTFNN